MPANRYISYDPGDPMAAGNWPGSAEGRLNPETYPTVGQLNSDSPVWDINQGIYVNGRTKKPWTGKLASGMWAQNGRVSGSQPPGPASTGGIDPNNPSQRYQAVNITKTPDAAAAQSDLMTQFKQGADSALKGFDQYVNDFKTASSGAISAGKQAGDIAPVAASLANAQNRYSQSLGQAGQDYTALNQSTAAAEKGIVDTANQDLSLYDTALNNAENLAQAGVTKAVSRYGAAKNAAAGGANMGLGGDVAAIAAQKSYEASLPYEQAKIAKRYDILQNLDLPVQRDIANRETARIAQFDPAIAAQIYGSDQQTQLQIQSLKSAAAQQDWQTALQVLQVPAIAAQVRNQILAGDTTLLGALNQLYEQTHYQGLQDLLGVNVSQPRYFSQATGPYPGPTSSRYDMPPPGNNTGTFGGGGALTASNAPTTVAPAPGMASSRYTNDPSLGGYWDEGTGEFYQYGVPAVAQSPVAPANPNYGSAYGYDPRFARYDPTTGFYIDSRTGQVINAGAFRGGTFQPSQNLNDATINPALAGIS